MLPRSQNGSARSDAPLGMCARAPLHAAAAARLLRRPPSAHTARTDRNNTTTYHHHHTNNNNIHKMAEALAKGLIDKGVVAPNQICCTDPVGARRELFRGFGAEAYDNNLDVSG